MKQGITSAPPRPCSIAGPPGFKPARDIVVLFTGDEETNGNRRDARRDRVAHMDRRRVRAQRRRRRRRLRQGRAAARLHLQTAEKTFPCTPSPSATAAATAPSRARQCHLQLAHALERLEAYRFTPMLNETTRAYFDGPREEREGAARRRDARWLANPDDGAAADAIEATRARSA
jgi:hypothetical protein